MHVAVGLGNPGTRYAGTRHNLGFRVVETLAERRNGSWVKASTYLHSQIDLEFGPLLLVIPTTFMNSSGVAASDVMDRFSPRLKDLIVIFDDVHLDLGRNRIRRRGSDGGHNGLSSVTSSLDSCEIARLRMGIGEPPPGSGLIDFVLGEFFQNEKKIVEAQILRASEALECWVDRGLEEAMNRFNSLE